MSPTGRPEGEHRSAQRGGFPSSARTAALLVGVNALVSAALIALVHLWLVPERLPALAVLDVAELYRLKELQVAAVLVKRDASDEERAGALRRATGFGTEVSTLLQALPNECRCIVLARGAVMGSEPLLRDLTPDVRRRLGL